MTRAATAQAAASIDMAVRIAHVGCIVAYSVIYFPK
jgi:hypothetical protein